MASSAFSAAQAGQHPEPGSISSRASATPPAASATAARGTAARLATTPIGASQCAHRARAGATPSVDAMEAASPRRSQVGPAILPCSRPVNRRMLAAARKDSWKPGSSSAPGATASPTSPANPRAFKGCALQPRRRVHRRMTAIQHARTAEGRPPVTATYAGRSSNNRAPAERGDSPAARATHNISQAMRPTCIPEMASRWNVPASTSARRCCASRS